jgi:hypothetical protein
MLTKHVHIWVAGPEGLFSWKKVLTHSMIIEWLFAFYLYPHLSNRHILLMKMWLVLINKHQMDGMGCSESIAKRSKHTHTVIITSRYIYFIRSWQRKWCMGIFVHQTPPSSVLFICSAWLASMSGLSTFFYLSIGCFLVYLPHIIFNWHIVMG